MLRPDQKNRDRLRTENCQTCLLERKKGLSEGPVWMAVAKRDDGLDIFQLHEGCFSLSFVQTNRRQNRIRCRSNAKIILQIQHVRDFPDMSGILRVQPACVIRGPKTKTTQSDRVT